MNLGNPSETSLALENILDSFMKIKEEFQNNPLLKSNIIKKENGEFDFIEDKVKIDEKTSYVIKDYIRDMEMLIDRYIDTTVAFEGTRFSSSLTIEEINDESRKVAYYLRSLKSGMKKYAVSNLVNKNGETEYFVDLKNFFDKYLYVFVNDKETRFSKDVNETIDSLRALTAETLRISPLIGLIDNFKDAILRNDQKYLDNYKNAKKDLEQFKKVKRCFEKISQKEGDKIIDTLRDLEKTYGSRFHISAFVSSKRDKDSEYTVQDIYSALNKIQENLKASHALYGSNTLSEKIDICNLNYRYEAGGYFQSFDSDEKNHFNRNRLITMRTDHVAQTTLVHEVAHTRDYLASYATINEIVRSVNKVRAESGGKIIPKGSSFLSEEFMKEIIKDINGYHKYSSYLDQIEEPVFQKLIKESRDLFNLKMFGKTEVSSSEMKVSEEYTIAAKKITAAVAKTSFESLISADENNQFSNNPFVKTLRENDEIKNLMFKFWEKNLSASGVIHLAIANIRREKSNIVTPEEIILSEPISKYCKNEVLFIKTEGEKENFIAMDRNLYIQEISRLKDLFIEDAKKVCSHVDCKEMRTELEKIGSNEDKFYHIANACENTEGIKDLVKGISKENMPPNIAYLHEQEIIVTPMSFDATMKGIKELYHEQQQNETFDNAQYKRSGRELFARNSENIFRALDKSTKEKRATANFIERTVNAVKAVFIQENLLSYAVPASEAIDVNSITKTMQYQILEAERKITKTLEEIAENPNVVKDYLSKNPQKVQDVINYGNNFNFSREKMNMMFSAFESVDQVKALMKKHLPTIPPDLCSFDQYVEKSRVLDRVGEISKKTSLPSVGVREIWKNP